MSHYAAGINPTNVVRLEDDHITKTYEFRGVPYKIACTEIGQQDPSWFSFEDESDVRNRIWNIQPEDLVLDVGAAYGSYTLTALAAGATHVYAWSPQGPPGQATEATMLRESLALNGWADRCTIYETGLYDRPGYLNADTQAFSSEPSPGNGDVIKVGQLDAWFGHACPVGMAGKKWWLKLDVEGAEVDVLRGGAALLETLKPSICVENHNFKRAGIEREVRTLLESFGYKEISTTPYHAVSHSLYVPR